MNPTSLPQAMGKIVRLFNLCMTTGLKKENAKFNPVNLRLNIDFVSHPSLSDGLVNTFYLYVFKMTTYRQKRLLQKYSSRRTPYLIL